MRDMPLRFSFLFSCFLFLSPYTILLGAPHGVWYNVDNLSKLSMVSVLFLVPNVSEFFNPGLT
ncbi:hypothetical protein DPMN_076198 [Dreissena polymorpha]|uniref:Uncharacterized protein n=1 Tax=Dreissena polymorpha TaxID=45954 RepID=A0A9D3YL25_DREPO|nr:hypothetical protein DPMN_076198 [Dreissena polymorpha]